MEKKLENIEKLKLVMWDLDGTILDSRQQHYASSKMVLENHGFDLSKTFLKDFYGQTANHIIEEILGDAVGKAQFDQIIKERDIAYRELISRDAEFLAGVEQWLEEFHQMGLRQVIASSTALENIETIVQVLSAEKYFSNLFSGEHLPSKPDPAVFKMTLDHQGIAPENCLVIEDSPHGIQAAKSLGIKCIAPAVTFPPDQLSEADLVVDNLELLRMGDIRSLFTGD
jgi:HAD superfamily hydrolase (TIGR01509 family)